MKSEAPAPEGTGTQHGRQADNPSLTDGAGLAVPARPNACADTGAEAGRRDELLALAAVRVGGLCAPSDPVTNGLLLASALVYAAHGWAVFPLRGKQPYKGTHGVLDATTDIATVCRWWAVERVGANIGGRIPAGVFLLDTDPRKEGHAAAAAALTDRYGPFPRTLTHMSGRCDGGFHRSTGTLVAR